MFLICNDANKMRFDFMILFRCVEQDLLSQYVHDAQKNTQQIPQSSDTWSPPQGAPGAPQAAATAQAPPQGANWGAAGNWDGEAAAKETPQRSPQSGYAANMNPYEQKASSEQTSWEALRRKNGDDWEAVRRQNAQRPQ